MKTFNYILAILFVFNGLIASAQGGDEQTRQETRKAMKIAIITKRVGLTEEESKKFWPIHDAMEQEMKALRKDYKKKNKSDKKLEDLSDQELEALLNASFEFKQKQLDLKRKYHTKYKEVLPIRKIAKLYHVEKRINQEIKSRDQGKPRGDFRGRR